MAFTFVPADAPQRDAVIERHVIPDLGSLADHHPHAVVNEKPASDGRTGMDLNPGQKSS